MKTYLAVNRNAVENIRASRECLAIGARYASSDCARATLRELDGRHLRPCLRRLLVSFATA